jgi:hypothetical protein
METIRDIGLKSIENGDLFSLKKFIEENPRIINEVSVKCRVPFNLSLTYLGDG